MGYPGELPRDKAKSQSSLLPRAVAFPPLFTFYVCQSYTRGKFRITRHDAVPGEQKRPLFSTGKRALASDAGDRRGSSGMRKDNRSLPRGERQPGRVSRRFSTPANTSMYSRSFGGGEFPQLSASRFSSPGAGSSSTPTQGSRFYFGRGAAVFPAADDNAEDGSSSSSSSAVSRGCPPLVVIDGSNAAFAYREGDRRWHAEGPLLAIQVRACLPGPSACVGEGECGRVGGCSCCNDAPA